MSSYLPYADVCFAKSDTCKIEDLSPETLEQQAQPRNPDDYRYMGKSKEGKSIYEPVYNQSNEQSGDSISVTCQGTNLVSGLAQEEALPCPTCGRTDCQECPVPKEETWRDKPPLL